MNHLCSWKNTFFKTNPGNSEGICLWNDESSDYCNVLYLYIHGVTLHDDDIVSKYF